MGNEYLHFITVTIIVLGSLLWGSIGLFGYNPLGRLPIKTHWIYVIIGLSGMYQLIHRDSFFLPFFSYGVMPCSVLSITEPINWDTEIEIPAPEGSMVIYWAAESYKRFNDLPDIKHAYGNYNNSGVAVAQANGLALARIMYPTSYKLGYIEQKPHINYRYCMRNNPVLSEVYTKLI